MYTLKRTPFSYLETECAHICWETTLDMVDKINASHYSTTMFIKIVGEEPLLLSMRYLPSTVLILTQLPVHLSLIHRLISSFLM